MGGTPLYKPYRYKLSQKLKGFNLAYWYFGLKIGIHFAYFGLESGMGFEGVTGV